ncbi:MAG TPA: cysteine desulfurase family protein [Actinomycetota bacterium]|nr:cysteine desulfurase family protein [Actinomycetota bacterium]
MTDDGTYLDEASGAPPSPAARDAAARALDAFGDPLFLHRPGRRARAVLERAREEVAAAIGAQPDEVVFTSGGTESVALAIGGAAGPGGRVVVSAVEHPAVLGAAQALAAEGGEVVRVPVDAAGRLDLDRFAAEIRRPGTILASVQHANHEVGTLQPVAEAARLAREAGVRFHTDACQTVGRLPVDVQALGCDLLSLSGRKFGGPPGAGVLVVRRGVVLRARPHGDERERRRRAGMPDLPAIAGLAAALQEALRDLPDQAARQWGLTDRLRAGIPARVPGARVHGHPTQRAPHLVCFSVPGVDPEALLMGLDDRGLHVGGGSVVSGAPGEPSPVLEAMGLPGTPAFRVGIGRRTPEEAIDQLLETLPGLVAGLRTVETAAAESLARLRRDRG